MAREMKDSGIEWYGSIPKEWEISKVGLHYDIILGKMLCSEPPSADYTLENYYCAANVHFDGISGTEALKQMWFSSQEKKLYKVRRGDMLVVEGGAGAGGCAIVPDDAQDTYIQNSIMIVRNKNFQENRYLCYLVEYMVKSGYVDVVCNKATIPHFTKDKLSGIPYPVISLSEMSSIVEFLDNKCAEIDETVVQTQEAIEEYKALKQAVIAEAVTKGVRGDRPMKDSNIEWISIIPEEWDAAKGKQLFRETNIRSKDGTEGLLTVSHITGITPRSEKSVNMFMSETLVDYKICCVGDIAANTMWMWQGAIGVSKYHGVISPSYNTYRQIAGAYEPEYLDYLLRIRPLVDTYVAYSTGITASRLRLYPEQFLSLRFIVPPIDEQREIATYLDAKCAEIDGLISAKQRLLAELESYKKSVIYEYVTGKKEAPVCP